MQQELPPVGAAKALLWLGIVFVGFGFIALLGRSTISNHIEQQAINAEIQGQANNAAVERQERERIVQEEQQAREDKMRKERLEQAKLVTVPGTSYIGTISNNKQIQRIRLVFTEQEGFLIRVVVSSPDYPVWKRVFIGELVVNPKPERNNPDDIYPIVMSSVGGSSYIDAMKGGFAYFYQGEGVPLKLHLTDTGLEGESDTTALHWGVFTIHLQRDKTPPATSSSHTDSKPESDSSNHIYFDAGKSADSQTAIAAALVLKWNQEQADEGDPAALLRMGERYRDGEGVKKDLAKAAEYFKRADKTNDIILAQQNEESKRKEQEAIQQKFIQNLALAEKGQVNPMIYVGKCYQGGVGVEKDLSKARQWFQKASDKGSTEAVQLLFDLSK
jgi:hypothetical protein